MKTWLAMIFGVLLALPAAAKENWLSRSELSSAFEGKTIIGKYTNGTAFTETYWYGGSINYKDDYSTMDGQWSVTDQGFCTFYDKMNGACFMVRVQGKNCFDFFAVEDQETGPMPGNKPVLIAQGWYPDKPPTCQALSS